MCVNTHKHMRVYCLSFWGVCAFMYSVYADACIWYGIEMYCVCVGYSMYAHVLCVCVCVYALVRKSIPKTSCDIIFKADCIWVGRKLLEAKGKSRSTTFVQREKRKFQTAQNGVFPSVAIFAGQLKRNQLYACMLAHEAIYMHIVGDSEWLLFVNYLHRHVICAYVDP